MSAAASGSGSDDDNEDSGEDSGDDSEEDSPSESASVTPLTVPSADHPSNLAGNGYTTTEKLGTSEEPATTAVEANTHETDDTASVEDDESESESEDAPSDSEDDDDDDEEEEPALKYEKLGGAAQEVLGKDTASALTVSLRLMVRTHACVYTLSHLNGYIYTGSWDTQWRSSRS